MTSSNQTKAANRTRVANRVIRPRRPANRREAPVRAASRAIISRLKRPAQQLRSSSH